MAHLSRHGRALLLGVAARSGGLNSGPAKSESNCTEIARSYELVRTEAVSVQTNAALFAATEGGCDDLARKLLDAGASLLARDRSGAMPFAAAAREGRLGLVELFLARAPPIDARAVIWNLPRRRMGRCPGASTLPNLPGMIGTSFPNGRARIVTKSAWLGDLRDYAGACER